MKICLNFLYGANVKSLWPCMFIRDCNTRFLIVLIAIFLSSYAIAADHLDQRYLIRPEGVGLLNGVM